MLRKLLGPFILFAALFLKFAKFLPMLFKMGKFTTILTMFISIWVYSQRFGWPFAFGFVLLMFIHELGHYMMMRSLGVDAGVPVFIPFVGAVIQMRGQPRDAWVEALIGIAGPLVGSLAAFLLLAYGISMQSEFSIALAETGIFLNLFNMLPVTPMDGGRVMAGISRYLLLVGFGFGILFYYQFGNSLLLLMLILGGMQVYRTFRYPIAGYFAIPMTRRIILGIGYFALLFILFVAYQIARQYGTESSLNAVLEFVFLHAIAVILWNKEPFAKNSGL